MRPIDLPDLSGLTLLVVEDESDALELLQIFLTACGAHVLAARTGVGALTYVDTAPRIDVLITDLSMPAMDGIELLCRVRAHRAGQTLLAIAVTGHYDKYLGINTTGFDVLLKKPADLPYLAERIRALVKVRNGD